MLLVDLIYIVHFYSSQSAYCKLSYIIISYINFYTISRWTVVTIVFTTKYAFFLNKIKGVSLNTLLSLGILWICNVDRQT